MHKHRLMTFRSAANRSYRYVQHLDMILNKEWRRYYMKASPFDSLDKIGYFCIVTQKHQVL